MPSRYCICTGCPACTPTGCGRLYDRDTTRTWRCPPCQPAVDAQRRARAAAGRPTTTTRGYGSVHRRRAAAIVAEAKALGLPCGVVPGCGGQPCLPGQNIVAHHPDGKPHLADPATCELVPAHAACNSGHRPGARPPGLLIR